jgi:hypothetical protein
MAVSVWGFWPDRADSKEQTEDSIFTVAESNSTEAAISESDEAEAPTEEQAPAADGSSAPKAATPTDGQDSYHTDPVPEGKPKPAEPQEQNVNEKKQYACTLYIECAKILDNMDKLNPDKASILPPNGMIYAKKTVTFYEGESAADLLKRETRNNGIHMEFSDVPTYNSSYIEGIANLYAFDCGNLSGWMYSVNGWFPNYGCSRYMLAEGDVVAFRYTCDLGRDLGAPRW